MPDDVDLGLSGPLLEGRDRFIDLFGDFSLVTYGRCRVVVDLVDPAPRVAVAFKAHLLRREIRARALEAVDEQHRAAFEGRRARDRRCGQLQSAAGQGSEKQA